VNGLRVFENRELMRIFVQNERDKEVSRENCTVRNLIMSTAHQI
jgi:hypothetical protein